MSASVPATTDETIYFDEGGIKITNSRAVLGGRTYAMSGITSVSEFIKYPSRIFPLVIFVIAAVVAMWAFGANNNIVAWVVAALIALFGVFAWRTSATSYLVRIGSASGESNAYSSTNQEQIKKIVGAINTAIIKRG